MCRGGPRQRLGCCERLHKHTAVMGLSQQADQVLLVPCYTVLAGFFTRGEKATVVGNHKEWEQTHPGAMITEGRPQWSQLT